MVKKIQGGRRTSGPTAIQSTKTVESAKVGRVDQVKAKDAATSAASPGSVGRKITPEMKEQLLQLIDEEADKMFGSDEAPASKKATLKGAVKMAIEAGLLPEDEA